MFAYMHCQLKGDWAAMQVKMHCRETVKCLKQLWDNLVTCTARAGPLLETYVAAVVRGRALQHAFGLAVICLSKTERSKLLAATRPEDRPALHQVLSQASPAEDTPAERMAAVAQRLLPPRGPRPSADPTPAAQLQDDVSTVHAEAQQQPSTAAGNLAGTAAWPLALMLPGFGSMVSSAPVAVPQAQQSSTWSQDLAVMLKQQKQQHGRVQLGHTLQQHALALAPPFAPAKQHADLQQDPGNSQAQQVRTHHDAGPCVCCCSSCALGMCLSRGQGTHHKSGA